MARLLRNASFLKRVVLGQPESLRRGALGASPHVRSFASKGKRKSKSDKSDASEDSKSKKEVALQQVLDKIAGSYGKGSIMWFGKSASTGGVPVVSTGSFALDIALGIGGLPKGRVVEICGPAASGKTTLALHVIAEAQKQGGNCVFVDARHSFDSSLANSIGINTQNLLLLQPDNSEEALHFVDNVIRSGSIDVVVVDSVAALVPKSELDSKMEMAVQARLISQTLRKLSHTLSSSQTVLIFICQVNANSEFGGPTDVSVGGNALKHYASVRLDMKRIELIKKGGEAVGSLVLVNIVKNKLAPPYKAVHFELERGRGICQLSEIINLAMKYKYITVAGDMYTFETQSFHGKEALKEFLTENNDAREELMMKVRERLLNGDTEKAAGAEANYVEPAEEIIVPDLNDEEIVTRMEA